MKKPLILPWLCLTFLLFSTQGCDGPWKGEKITVSGTFGKGENDCVLHIPGVVLKTINDNKHSQRGIEVSRNAPAGEKYMSVICEFQVVESHYRYIRPGYINIMWSARLPDNFGEQGQNTYRFARGGGDSAPTSLGPSSLVLDGPALTGSFDFIAINHSFTITTEGGSPVRMEFGGLFEAIRSGI